jgi:dynein heavy chain
MYVGKYNQIVEKEIKMISQRATENNYKISNKFAEIETQIRKVPKNIEELTETKKYVSEIGIVIEKLKKEIDECMGTYQICEEFNYEFSSTENDNKWKLYGAPLGIIETIQNQSAVLEKQRENFIKQMEEEQAEFEETLDGLLITVEGFGTFNDITKYMEIAENVESVNDRLAECLDKSRLFNSREFLVGKEQKDYTRLGYMNKEFKPFSDLWLNTRTWH